MSTLRRKIARVLAKTTTILAWVGIIVYCFKHVESVERYEWNAQYILYATFIGIHKFVPFAIISVLYCFIRRHVKMLLRWRPFLVIRNPHLNARCIETSTFTNQAWRIHSMVNDEGRKQADNNASDKYIPCQNLRRIVQFLYKILKFNFIDFLWVGRVL